MDPGPESARNWNRFKRPGSRSSRFSSVVAVQATDKTINGKRVKASVISGPKFAPIFPLSLKSMNCVMGIYAAIIGRRRLGLACTFLRMNKLKLHPTKHETMTAFECQIAAEYDP